jgi:hypothetical protein
VVARHFQRSQPLIFWPFAYSTQTPPRGGSRRRDEKPRPLHVHRHRDELKMAVVAIQAEIANLRHPIPVLHRRVRALDADANARRRLVEPYLPVDQRLVALGLVGDPVLDPEFAELVAQRLAVVGLVGVVGPLVALPTRPSATSRWSSPGTSPGGRCGSTRRRRAFVSASSARTRR